MASRGSSTRLPEAWPTRVRTAVVYAVAIARTSLVLARFEAENHFDERLRLRAEVDRLGTENALLAEEIRIKDARMERLAPQRRPYYPAIERLAILELRAARGWTVAETARRLLVTPVTVASWNSRLDERGPDALLKVPVPVNRFPDFVYLRRAQAAGPLPVDGHAPHRHSVGQGGTAPGKDHGASHAPAAAQAAKAAHTRKSDRVVTARASNHVWHVDLTTVPTGFGFWIPWLPLALPQRWPFCWLVAVAVDHYSRRVVGTTAFASMPSAPEMTAFLGKGSASDCAAGPPTSSPTMGRSSPARTLGGGASAAASNSALVPSACTGASPSSSAASDP